MDWITIIQNVGIPVALLTAGGTGVVKVIQWLAPRVDDLIDAHKGFLNSMANTQIEIKDAIVTGAGTQAATAVMIEEIHTHIVRPR